MPSGRVPPDRLRYLDPPHRLRLVGAVKQLRPDRGPVLLQVRGQCIDAHAVDARRPLVALNLRQRLPQIVTLDNRFHRRPNRPPGFRDSAFAARASVPSAPALRASPLAPVRKVSSSSDFLPHGPREIAALLAIPPFGPSAGRPAYYALC